MKVVEIMTSPVQFCRRHDTLSHAAQLMWDYECGALPVLDEHGDPVGMITDRDICMAAYTQGKALHDISVQTAASHRLVSVRPQDSLEHALSTMRANCVRRLPVVDSGRTLIGVVSLVAIARAGSTREPSDAVRAELIGASLVEVSRPHSSPPSHHSHS